MHCQQSNQKKIAKYIKMYMGDRVYLPPSDQADGKTDGALPSPWELRGKILVKGKTLKRFQGADEEEEEFEVL